MASLSSLPNELVIDIIEYLRSHNDETPIIGINSMWKQLSAFRNSLVALEIDQLSSEIGQLDLSQEESNKTLTIHSPLKAFRATCSLYNELCKPVIYQDCNIIHPYPTEQTWGHCLFVLHSYPQHVRSIRLLTNGYYDKTLPSSLSLCRNATSIAIYYDINMTTYIHRLKECIVGLFENGKLNSLGIYWNRIMDGSIPQYRNPNLYDPEIADLLNSIAQNPKARKSIIKLDLAIPLISQETYGLIRSELTSLQSLTVRRAFRKHLPRIWDFPSANMWYKNANLTRLQLMDCQIAYSVQIPHLVRHFVGLQYLTISTCGQWSDHVVQNPLPKERYSQADALCKIRKPLKSLHIEHMEDWEIAMMGDIPTETLLITNVGNQHLESVFKADRDLFPSLRLLRLESQPLRDENVPVIFVTEVISTLKELCKVRGIELRQDAQRLLPFRDHNKELGLTLDS